MRRHAAILVSALAVAGALVCAAEAQAGVNARQHRQHRDLNRASRNIYRQKHDGQTW